MPRRGDGRSELEAITSPAVIAELKRSVPGFDGAKLAGAIVAYFGGEDAFARFIVREIQDPRTQPILRQKYMSMVCGLIHRTGERDMVPASQLSDEDLFAALDHYKERLIARGKADDAGAAGTGPEDAEA